MVIAATSKLKTVRSLRNSMFETTTVGLAVVLPFCMVLSRATGKSITFKGIFGLTLFVLMTYGVGLIVRHSLHF